MTVEVWLLGPFRVAVAGRAVELPAGRLPALLAVLAMSAGQTVSVDRLATAVWGEELSVDARANVRSTPGPPASASRFSVNGTTMYPALTCEDTGSSGLG